MLLYQESLFLSIEIDRMFVCFPSSARHLDLVHSTVGVANIQTILKKTQNQTISKIENRGARAERKPLALSTTRRTWRNRWPSTSPTTLTTTPRKIFRRTIPTNWCTATRCTIGKLARWWTRGVGLSIGRSIVHGGLGLDKYYLSGLWRTMKGWTVFWKRVSPHIKFIWTAVNDVKSRGI